MKDLWYEFGFSTIALLSIIFSILLWDDQPVSFILIGVDYASMICLGMFSPPSKRKKKLDER